MSTWKSEMTKEDWQVATESTVKTEQMETITDHVHQWDKYLHTAYVLRQLLPREHHCNVCSVCYQIQCETTNVGGNA